MYVYYVYCHKNGEWSILYDIYNSEEFKV